MSHFIHSCRSKNVNNDKLKSLLLGVPGVGAVIVLVVAFLGGFQSPTSSEKFDPTSKDKSTPRIEDGKGGVPTTYPPFLAFLLDREVLKRREPKADYLGMTPSEFNGLSALISPLAGVPSAQPDDKELCWRPAVRQDSNIDFYLVDVPDPEDTELGFRFDQLLDVISQAMADDGRFTIEHHWLPWRLGQLEAAKGADRRLHPGVLVYRGSKDWKGDDARRVVLLIGENPVNGIHKKAAQNALELIRAVRFEPQVRFKWVGPFTTGGQKSVLEAVIEWQKRNGTAGAKFDVFSGSANGLRDFWTNKPHTRESTALFFRPEEYRTEVYKHCRIRTTQAPTTLLQEAALRYLAGNRLCELGNESAIEIDPMKFGFLVEMNSGYGNRSAAEWKWDKRDKRDKWETVPPAESKIEPTSKFGEIVRSLWQFRFPMHISKLASFQAQDRQQRDEKVRLERGDGRRLAKEDGTRNMKDDIPSADEVRTAEMNRRAMQDSWDTINREGIRYMGIAASDPRDAMFLVEMLRKHCPCTQPFILGSDMHYGHPTYRQFMRGTILVSFYPLNPVIRQWEKTSGADMRQPTFASYSGEGTYNAILALRAVNELCADKRREIEAKMFCYNSPSFDNSPTGKPPIWVTVVGEDGRFHPLAHYSQYEDHGLVYQTCLTLNPEPASRSLSTASAEARTVTRPVQTPPTFTPVFGFTLSLAILFAFAVWCRWKTRLVTPDSLRKATEFKQERLRRELMISLAWLGLLLVALPLAMYALAVPQDWGWWERFCLSLFSDLVLFAVVLYPLSRTYVARDGSEKLRPERGGARDWTLWVTGAITIAIVVLAVSLIVLAVVLKYLVPDSVGIPFRERTAATFSGHSVLTPCFILGTAFVLYACSGLWNIRRGCAHRIGPFFVEERSKRSGRISELRTALESQTGDLARLAGSPEAVLDDKKWRWLLILGVVFVGTFHICVTLGRVHPLLEAGVWNWVFAVAFAFLGTCVVIAGVRIVVTWREIETTTRLLMALPLAAAFARLPKAVSDFAVKILLFGHRRATDLNLFVVLETQIRSSQALPASTSSPGPDPGRNTLYGQYMDAVSTNCRLLFESLEKYWATRTLSDMYDVPAGKAGEDPEWVAPAEEYIALATIFHFAPYFDRLRHFGYKLAACSAAYFLAVTSYAFQPELVVMLSGTIVVFLCIGLVVWVLLRIARNEYVSRVSQQDPSKLTIGVPFWKEIGFVVVPLVILLVTQWSGRLRILVEPIFENVKW